MKQQHVVQQSRPQGSSSFGVYKWYHRIGHHCPSRSACNPELRAASTGINAARARRTPVLTVAGAPGDLEGAALLVSLLKKRSNTAFYPRKKTETDSSGLSVSIGWLIFTRTPAADGRDPTLLMLGRPDAHRVYRREKKKKLEIYSLNTLCTAIPPLLLTYL